MAWWGGFSAAAKAGLAYLLVINLMTFFYFIYDKSQSVRGGRRVSERTLWLLALFGGSLGALLSMHLTRHKTKKLSFQAGLALIIALQIIILLVIAGYAIK
ncbi:MAG: hypothetical protein UY92_C0010G0005 [Candidatus Magasanikbacteria bacterium GW2011_GWA2_56_11]|uniref:DUF1294 domain-containing protein n=1 Tax=Candidatus Magasanikbacteria bacterium GW2011_GWA2_56_11 TaxID=1619044 RepID=A0A0G2B9E9_9BACT|nr:MAG: hypothetical protein UY92_C0010G0005 [Candidatus Magasanikbacteria bacterium GW2011_GWA2_56_11]